MTILFTRVAGAARADPRVAEQVREALASSGLLQVFGTADTLDVVDLLDMGGEVALRARLRQLSLAELKQIINRHNYDEAKETTRWRSANKCIDLIVNRTQQRLESELAKEPANAASWML
jgi:hypothetical protein